MPPQITIDKEKGGASTPIQYRDTLENYNQFLIQSNNII